MDEVNFSKRKFESLSNKNNGDQIESVGSNESSVKPNCQNSLSSVTTFIEQTHNSSNHNPLMKTISYKDELVDMALLDQFNLLQACYNGDLILVQRILSENKSYYHNINQIMTSAVMDEVSLSSVNNDANLILVFVLYSKGNIYASDNCG